MNLDSEAIKTLNILRASAGSACRLLAAWMALTFFWVSSRSTMSCWQAGGGPAGGPEGAPNPPIPGAPGIPGMPPNCAWAIGADATASTATADTDERTRQNVM